MLKILCWSNIIALSFYICFLDTENGKVAFDKSLKPLWNIIALSFYICFLDTENGKVAFDKSLKPL